MIMPVLFLALVGSLRRLVIYFRCHLAVSGVVVAVLLVCLMAPERLWAVEELKFAVFLDDREIGTHDYRFVREESGFRLESEARYQVKFLFITAYRYHHLSREEWQDGCLSRINASTDANGEDFRVQGQLKAEELVLTVNGDERRESESCPRTYSYWNPDLLDTDRLLNAQTGELAETRLRNEGWQALPWQNGVEALKYTLISDDAEIILWYDENARWLGLESPLDNGRLLQYRYRGSESGQTGQGRDTSSTTESL